MPKTTVAAFRPSVNSCDGFVRPAYFIPALRAVMVALAFVIITAWILFFVAARGLKARLFIIFFPIFLLGTPIALWVLKTVFVPVHSAQVEIPDLRATIQLEFYGVLACCDDSGRYLYLKTSAGSTVRKMTELDWVHWPRTSLYLTGDGRIAVLGPAYDDYVLDPKTLTIEPLRAGTPSDRWTYFGAFGAGLRFIPASEQRECTDARGQVYAWETRPQGRAERCSAIDLRN
jgi:hypothetical protein